MTGWNPPRGSVTVVPSGRGLEVRCGCCGWTYRAAARTDGNDQKRWHRCPPGTPGALPTCPDCRATGRRCKRPSGHGAAEWHAARRLVFERGAGS